ncbi:uncharacterized protein LOC123527603 [Mercenaria mercenaria]|uniref:uncharacterized protein LOC123527603 n=1 Tax=Mercenaria mercenaria TaxID=6596 RepID=UPI001E1D4D8F|nr:uncharacterized protein LOC123527603 [Mercenaria mercenaria]
MKVLVLFLASAIYVGANQHHDLATVAHMVVADADTNHDGAISVEELKHELIAKWDRDANPTDMRVSKHDFLTQWTARYGDFHHDASVFFDKLDTNKDGQLSESDLLFHIFTLDPDLNGLVTPQEFEAFIMKNHPCGHHGKFGCGTA